MRTLCKSEVSTEQASRSCIRQLAQVLPLKAKTTTGNASCGMIVDLVVPKPRPVAVAASVASNSTHDLRSHISNGWIWTVSVWGNHHGMTSPDGGEVKKLIKNNLMSDTWVWWRGVAFDTLRQNEVGQDCMRLAWRMTDTLSALRDDDVRGVSFLLGRALGFWYQMGKQRMFIKIF